MDVKKKNEKNEKNSGQSRKMTTHGACGTLDEILVSYLAMSQQTGIWLRHFY